MRWHALLRPGDWLVMAGGAALVGISLPLLWQGGFADRAIIRQNGQIFAEAVRALATTGGGGDGA